MSDVAEELATASTPNEKRCAICSVHRSRHDELVKSGELHHSFSEQGELVHITPQKPQARRVVAGNDLVLRLALVNAGVITHEDLLRAEAVLRELPDTGRPRPRGDRADRPAAGT